MCKGGRGYSAHCLAPRRASEPWMLETLPTLGDGAVPLLFALAARRVVLTLSLRPAAPPLALALAPSPAPSWTVSPGPFRIEGASFHDSSHLFPESSIFPSPPRSADGKPGFPVEGEERGFPKGIGPQSEPHH